MGWLILLSSVAVLFDNTLAKAINSDFTHRNELNKDSRTFNTSGQFFGSCKEVSSLKSCLKMRALKILDDFSQKDTPIELFGNSLSLVKNTEAGTGGRILPTSVEELDSNLPNDDLLREETLDKLIALSLAKIVKTRALQIRLPDFSSWNDWNSSEEGRKKKGGGGGAGWALMMGGGMMGALGLGAIALLAGKALMVSMMALMLSILGAMKKGGGGGGDHAATTYEVINVPTGHGHHRRSYGVPRSLLEVEDLSSNNDSEVSGFELAYRAYPKQLPLPTTMSK